jgi:hypothetical protein
MPERTVRSRHRKKLQYAMLATVTLHGGTEPDLLDEVACSLGDRRLLAARPAHRRRLHPRRHQPVGVPGMPGSDPAPWPPSAITIGSGHSRSGRLKVGKPLITAVRVCPGVAVRDRPSWGQFRRQLLLPGGAAPSAYVTTGRCPLRMRRRCTWRAGPGCRGPGRTASWCVDRRARRPLARRAAGPRHPARP